MDDSLDSRIGYADGLNQDFSRGTQSPSIGRIRNLAKVDLVPKPNVVEYFDTTLYIFSDQYAALQFKENYTKELSVEKPEDRRDVNLIGVKHYSTYKVPNAKDQVPRFEQAFAVAKVDQLMQAADYYDFDGSIRARRGND
jgi:hypothetical protein